MTAEALMFGQRYMIAMLLAVVATIVGALYRWHTDRAFLKHFRETLRAAKQAGELPPELEGVDPETVTREGFDIEVSRLWVWRIWIADQIATFWFILIPLVVAGCFACAWFVGRLRGGG